MPSTRTQVLAGGSALAVFAPALLTSMMKEAAAATPSDIDLLNGAIELEHAGINTYTDGFSLNLLSSRVLQIAKGFRAGHEAHAAALSAAVRSAGATPTTKTTKIDYPALKSEAVFRCRCDAIELQLRG